MSAPNSPRARINISKQIPELIKNKRLLEAKFLLESSLTDPFLPTITKITFLNNLANVNTRINKHYQALELLKQANDCKNNLSITAKLGTLINFAAAASYLSDHKSAY